MKASNSFSDLTSATDAALKKLKYSFHKNGNEHFAEFEITLPSEFVIRIEDMAGEIRDFKLAMFTRQEFGCSFQVIGAPLGNRESGVAASRVVRELLSDLKRKPWQDLGFVRSKTVKVLWSEWAELASKA